MQIEWDLPALRDRAGFPGSHSRPFLQQAAPREPFNFYFSFLYSKCNSSSVIILPVKYSTQQFTIGWMHNIQDSKLRLWFESRFNIIFVCATTKTFLEAAKVRKLVVHNMQIL